MSTSSHLCVSASAHACRKMLKSMWHPAGSGSRNLCGRREEREKLNMWVAYLNLENTYGQPPDEAVMKLFLRALQHVDQKKLYLALLAVLENGKKVHPLSLLGNK